jgi:hypothetical protein
VAGIANLPAKIIGSLLRLIGMTLALSVQVTTRRRTMTRTIAQGKDSLQPQNAGLLPTAMTSEVAVSATTFALTRALTLVPAPPTTHALTPVTPGSGPR